MLGGALRYRLAAGDRHGPRSLAHARPGNGGQGFAVGCAAQAQRPARREAFDSATGARGQSLHTETTGRNVPRATGERMADPTSGAARGHRGATIGAGQAG